MKHLLTGVAMAAALAITAPVWAQTPPPAPMTPPAAAPKAPAPAAPMATTPMATKPMAKKPMAKMPMKHMHHMAMHKHMMMSSGDKMTEDLNKQELARLQGGGAAPAPAPSGGPAPMGGNYPTSGMGSPMAPSAPPPPK